MNNLGFGAQGSAQSQDCAFPAGQVLGAPIRISWYLVLLFGYQLLTGLQNSSDKFFVFVLVCGQQAILIFTILCHEFGHGTMARYLGGSIAHILLWPFGGICFSTRPPTDNMRQKLSNELKIVTAGPVTHFPMAAVWLGLLSSLYSAWGLQGSPLHALNPWDTYVPYGIPGYWSLILYELVANAVRINILLFLFNVFFPMYPMDGSKMLVCTLSLCCNVPARRCAWILLFLTVPASLYFIVTNARGLLYGGGNMMGGVAVMLGLMCLMESWKIYDLLGKQMLHTHPLFEHARSDIVRVQEEGVRGGAIRINTAARDDQVMPQAASTRSTAIRPFEGNGVNLGVVSESGRGQFLERIDAERAHQQKSVRQLQEERFEKEEEDRRIRRGQQPSALAQGSNSAEAQE